MNLADILKDSNYKLSQFTTAEIKQLEQAITLKATKSGEVPYTVCLVRQKAIKLTPEEAIRQLYLRVLTDRLHYPLDRIQVEYGVNFGREVKRADIVVMDKDRLNTVYMLVELKKLKDGKDQLRSYCNATGAPIAVWTNGDQISYYQRKDPNYFEDIPGLPNVNQTLADILQIKFTLEDLIANDKLVKENKSLKTLIEEMEDEVLANAGMDVFEELFKLIFTKLYDEWYSGQGNRRKTRSLEFRNTGQTETALKSKIQDLFDGAKRKWEGVFSEDAKISLTPSHLSVCVSSLENVKLFNSNLDVIDEAFEYLINQSSKGDKGQYFTPRYVIDMCVKMLNPQEDEYTIDTAAGSSGFPVHTIFHVWRQILMADVDKPVGLQVGDILFTCKGSFGNSAVVTEREVNGIISSEIMLVRLTSISKQTVLPEYVSLFLNSKFGYLQVERRVHGVAYYSISQPDLANLLIPILPKPQQQKIVEKIKSSFASKLKTKQLLEIAKTGVERAIEADEATATAWINQQLEALGVTLT